MKLEESTMPRSRRRRENDSEAEEKSSLSSSNRRKKYRPDGVSTARDTYVSSRRGNYDESISSSRRRRQRLTRSRSRSEHRGRRRGYSHSDSKHFRGNRKQGKDEKETARSRDENRDEKDGHLTYHPGDWMQSRYEILRTLGEGTFAKCVECYDRKSGQSVAVKIIKNVERYREAANLEIKVLERIRKNNSVDKSLCILLMDWFNHNGHVCLIFEKLGLSVFEFMKENNYQAYPLDHVRNISHQLTTAIKFLHNMRLCHTDLKPENILFTDSAYDNFRSCTEKFDDRVLRKSDIKVIDFGSATFEDEHHSTTVSTRHYRAPEVVLELGWSYPCDMWSIGCIMFELYAGFTLFQTHENKEHLAMMERILGTLPSSMCWKSRKTKYFYKGRLDWDERSSDGKYVRENCKTLRKYATSKEESHELFFDLLERLLEYRPEKRINACEALDHPFFDQLYSPEHRTDSISPRTSR